PCHSGDSRSAISALASNALGCLVGVSSNLPRQPCSCSCRLANSGLISIILPIAAQPLQMATQYRCNDGFYFSLFERLLASRVIDAQHDIEQQRHVGETEMKPLSANARYRAVALAVADRVRKHPMPV